LWQDLTESEEEHHGSDFLLSAALGSIQIRNDLPYGSAMEVGLDPTRESSTHFHFYVHTSYPTTITDIREIVAGNVYVAKEIQDSIHISTLRPPTAWIKYITKEDEQTAYSALMKDVSILHTEASSLLEDLGASGRRFLSFISTRPTSVS